MIRGPFNEGGISKAVDLSLTKREAIERVNDYLGWAREKVVFRNASDNHWTLAKDAEEANLLGGFPTVLTVPEILEKAWTHVRGETVNLRELYPPGEYLIWNLNGFRTSRDIFELLGEGDLAEAYAERLRGICATLALTVAWVTPRSMTATELVHEGPGLIVADGPSNGQVKIIARDRQGNPLPGAQWKTKYFNYTGLPSTAMCGVRAANMKQQGTAGRAPDPLKDGPLAWRHLPGESACELVQDILLRRLDNRGRALVARGGQGHWVSDSEAKVLHAASKGDPAATRQALDWMKAQGMPRNPFRLIRSDRFVVMACLSAPKAPTATLYLTEIEVGTGIHRFLVADPGNRSDIESGRCDVSLDGNLLSAVAKRLQAGKAAVLPEHEIGTVSLDIEFGGADKRWIERKAPGQTAPPPVVTPPPPKPDPGGKKKGKGGCSLLFWLALATALASAVWALT